MIEQHTYNIGPGVEAAMQQAGDEPRSSEMYFAEGISQTVGRDGLYYYIQADNKTNRVPFS